MAFSPVDTTLATVDQGINAAAQIAASVPGVGEVVAGILEVGEYLVNAIGIRKGADEADVITKVQTPLGNSLVQINSAIPYANAQQLQTMYSAVLRMGQQFKQFVGQNIFVDGRASTQALNTIMPLIDGTGMYSSKDSGPGCTHCGPAGGGEDGTLGSIMRQLNKMGGNFIMAPPVVMQGQQGGYLPSLESPSSQWGTVIPQASGLPLYPPSELQTSAPAVVDTGLFGSGSLPLIVGAALVFLFLRKRG
jgi:hypothetical protein